jgi:HSP20 family protein
LKSKPRRLIEEFYEINKEFDRAFESFSIPRRGVKGESTNWHPPMDIYETVEHFIVKIELAGIQPEEDVRLRLDNNVLKIAGYRRDRTQLKKQHYHQAELNYGPFERSVVLPNVLDEDCEAIASYENGFVEIKIPKMKQDLCKEISVQVKDEAKTIQPVNEESKELDDAEEK